MLMRVKGVSYEANTGTIQRSRRVVERVTGLVKFAKDD
jgi:hypothetical protein